MTDQNVLKVNSGKLPHHDATEALLNQAKNGSSDAFAALYNLSFDKVYRFIYYRVSHKETAEDLTEEVFIKAFAGIKDLQKYKAYEGWLFAIARNKVIDYYRSKKETVDLVEVENSLLYESTVLDTLQLESDQKKLLETLTKLPAEQQMILRMKFFEELSNSEIAAALHKSEGAIRVLQFRALANLKKLFSK